MYDVTPESIQRAKAAQQQERAAVFAKTGVRITDEEPAPYTIICPRCLYPATGNTNGLATRALAHHIIHSHTREGVRA